MSRGLPGWFEHNKPALMPLIAAWRPGGNPVYGPYLITLDGKPGTRPIGYSEAGTTPPGQSVARPYDYLGIVGLFLTYDSAEEAADRVGLGVRGLYQLHYVDASDHGDYTLYLQVERVTP